jgi:hypothetical protein
MTKRLIQASSIIYGPSWIDNLAFTDLLVASNNENANWTLDLFQYTEILSIANRAYWNALSTRAAGAWPRLQRGGCWRGTNMPRGMRGVGEPLLAARDASVGVACTRVCAWDDGDAVGPGRCSECLRRSRDAGPVSRHGPCQRRRPRGQDLHLRWQCPKLAGALSPFDERLRDGRKHEGGPTVLDSEQAKTKKSAQHAFKNCCTAVRCRVRAPTRIVDSSPPPQCGLPPEPLACGDWPDCAATRSIHCGRAGAAAGLARWWAPLPSIEPWGRSSQNALSFVPCGGRRPPCCVSSRCVPAAVIRLRRIDNFLCSMPHYW